MAEGNGIDLGSIAAMLTNLVSGQESLRVEVSGLLAGQERLRADLVAEIGTLRAETRAEFAGVRTELVTMRKVIDLYHGSVMGHGIAITALEERVERIEERLDARPAA